MHSLPAIIYPVSKDIMNAEIISGQTISQNDLNNVRCQTVIIISDMAINAVLCFGALKPSNAC